jgi:pre-rRNA-processing protein TSR1
MKCVFDGPLKSYDTVFLYLYKRMFSKWTYEDYLGFSQRNDEVGGKHEVMQE